MKDRPFVEKNFHFRRNCVMAREIINQLFEQTSCDTKATEEDFKCSLKDWKDLTSRMDQMQRQIQFCGERTDTLYSKVINWMSHIKDKVEIVSQTHQKLSVATQQLEETFQKQKQETSVHIQSEHKKTMSALQKYSQFIKNYEESLNNLKHSLSKNKHQMLQLLGEINLLHMEMGDKVEYKKDSVSKSQERTP